MQPVILISCHFVSVRVLQDLVQQSFLLKVFFILMKGNLQELQFCTGYNQL